MAASSGTGMVDPTKPSNLKYPVILSDDLLGKGSRELYTGVRYNHRPTEDAPSTARIKASTPGSGTFDLAFHDTDGSKYGFNGRRATDDNQFVLIFDPARKAFVLHRLDSLFNMNLVSTPTNDDAASLKEEYPHLTGHSIPTPARGGSAAKGKPGSKAGATSALRATNTKKKTPAAKGGTKSGGGGATAKKPASATSQKKHQHPAPESIPLPESPKAAALVEATPPKKKQPPPPADSDEDEDESDDDDNGLTVEYPGGPAPTARHQRTDFSPAFQPQQRSFDDFIQNGGGAAAVGAEEDEDADAEADFEEDEDFIEAMNRAPPAAAAAAAAEQSTTAAAAAAADDAMDEDAEADELDYEDELAAELEQELEGNMEVDDESDMSVED